MTIWAINLIAYVLVASGIVLLVWGYDSLLLRFIAVILMVISGIWLKFDAYTLKPSATTLSGRIAVLLISSFVLFIASILIFVAGDDRVFGYMANYPALTLGLSGVLIVFGSVLLWLAASDIIRAREEEKIKDSTESNCP